MATPTWWQDNEEGLLQSRRINTASTLELTARRLVIAIVKNGVLSPSTKIILEAGVRDGSVRVDVAQAIATGDLEVESPTNVVRGIVALERGDRLAARASFVNAASTAAAWFGVAVCEKGDIRRIALSRSVELDSQLLDAICDLLPPLGKPSYLQRRLLSTSALDEHEDSCVKRRRSHFRWNPISASS